MKESLPNYLAYRNLLLHQHPEYSIPLNSINTEGQESNSNGIPKITVVTPSYNQGHFIEDTIQSVLSQNYDNLEYIIMDGGSTDNTLDILDKYKQVLSFCISEKDRGQGHAINKGFSLASGEIYCWLNSDDYLLPGTLQTIAEVFVKNPEIDFVYGQGLAIDETSKEIEKVHVPYYFDRYYRIPTLLQPACFWRSSIHEPIWEELNCSLDYELWLRIAKSRKKRRLKIPLAVARKHAAAKTFNPKMKQAWEDDHQLICYGSPHGIVSNWNWLVKERSLLFKVINSFTR